MADENDPWLEKVSDADVVDPLSATARSARNALMICNLLLFGVVQVGFVPTRFSALGIETGQLQPSAIHLLAWLLILYFFVNFCLTIGAELQAWESRLDTLRERRQRRERSRLAERMARFEANDQDDKVLPDGWRSQFIADSNLAIQLDWRRYQILYRLRMMLEGPGTILISIANIVAAVLREAGHHLWQ